MWEHFVKDLREMADAIEQEMPLAVELCELLRTAPLPSVQGDYGEFLPRYTEWLKRRDAWFAKTGLPNY